MQFTGTFDPAHLEMLDGGADTQAFDTLAPGATTEVIYHARVHAAPGTAIDTSGSVTATETDNNEADNRDQVTIQASGGGGHAGPLRVRTEQAPDTAVRTDASAALAVTRSTVSQVVGTTRIAHEELTVENPSDATTTPIDLHDLVKDPNGTVIDDEAWPLGTLAPREAVTVTYDVSFAADAPAGVYLISTVLAGESGDTEFKNNGSIILPVPVAGAVLGTATAHPVSAPALLASRTDAVPSAPRSEEGWIEATTNPLLAAVENAAVSWQYALGFIGASAALLAFLGMSLWLRRRYSDT